MDERPLSCPLDDPLPERELLLEDRLLPEDLLEDEDLLPVDLLPEEDCFLAALLFDFCPLLRRAVAVCFMTSRFFLMVSWLSQARVMICFLISYNFIFRGSCCCCRVTGCHSQSVRCGW